jgi:predicted lipoprotein
MKNKHTTLLKWTGVAALIVLIACTCRVTVIPDEVPETTVNAEGQTVAVVKLSVAEQYCADNWDTKIVPTIKERAVDMVTFVSDAETDLTAAGIKYGNRANETSAWSFCVKGDVKVLDIENAEKPNKTLLVLDLAPYDGQPDCKLFYGKVFSSNIKNAIRDGVGFLHLDDFENQVEFADLTTAFNTKVKNDILSLYAATDLKGKELTFYGCISLTDATYENMVVIPVELAVVGG